jgi:hypothetical protein
VGSVEKFKETTLEGHVNNYIEPNLTNVLGEVTDINLILQQHTDAINNLQRV